MHSSRHTHTHSDILTPEKNRKEDGEQSDNKQLYGAHESREERKEGFERRLEPHIRHLQAAVHTLPPSK